MGCQKTLADEKDAKGVTEVEEEPWDLEDMYYEQWRDEHMAAAELEI